MRYRKLDADGDMTFGHGGADYYVDVPEAVGQAAETRLKLLTGEWYLDMAEGTPYTTEVLGKNTQTTYDPALRDRIIGTQGFRELVDYSSVLIDRELSVEATIDTIYGQITIQPVL